MFPKKDNRGGARAGSGRKPSEALQLKRLAIEKAADEAEKSLDFCRQVRDGEIQASGVQLEAAKEIMDRVWGKAKQSAEVKAVGRFVLVVQ